MVFPMGLVRPEDKDLVEPGAQLIYGVGRFFREGRVAPGSVLWFRRLARSSRTTQELLEAGDKLARQLTRSD